MANIDLAPQKKRELYQKGVLGELIVTEQRRRFFDPKDGTWTKPLPVCDGRLSQYLQKGFLLAPPLGWQAPLQMPAEPIARTETPVEIKQPMQYVPDEQDLAEIAAIPEQPNSSAIQATPAGVVVPPEMFDMFQKFLTFMQTQQPVTAPAPESNVTKEPQSFVCAECGFPAKDHVGLSVHIRKAHHPKRKYTKRS